MLYILTFQVLSVYSAKCMLLSTFLHFWWQFPGYFWTWADKIQISRFSRLPGSTGNPARIIILQAPCKRSRKGQLVSNKCTNQLISCIFCQLVLTEQCRGNNCIHTMRKIQWISRLSYIMS